MPKSILHLLALVWLAGIAHAQAPAPPGPATSAVTAEQARKALDVLQDPNKLQQLIETLDAIAKASAPPPPSSPPPQAGQAPGPALAPGSLAARVLQQTSAFVGDLADEIASAARTLTQFPALWHRLAAISSDAEARAGLLDAAWRLAIVLAAAWLAEWIAVLFLRRTRRALAFDSEKGEAEDAAPAHSGFLRRLPLALLKTILALLPVGLFAMVGTLLAALLGAQSRAHLVLLTFVHAYVLSRVILIVVDLLVSAKEARLRLLALGDGAALYTQRWAQRITIVAVFGAALAEAALALGFDPKADAALVKLVTLILAGFLIAIIIECRGAVAGAIRAPRQAGGPLAPLRDRIAAIWHYLAIFLIAALWVLWAIELQSSLSRILEPALATVGVLVAARLAAILLFGAFERLFHLGAETIRLDLATGRRAGRYYRMLRGAISAIIGFVTLIALLEVWGVQALAWFGRGSLGGSLLSALLTIAVSVIIAVIVWEVANAALDRHLARIAAGPRAVQAARIRTLVPILRTALFLTILAVVGLTALSEIGVNIGPLLAGAGIVGIAVGFGSQKLVQDLITGLFLLLENAVQVGDWVTVAGLSGSVEQLSIRTIHLRAADGSVHIIPFSAVTSVTNANRGIGNAVIAVNIALAEDIDKASRALKEIVAEMRGDPQFRPLMLSDLELWGVDKVDGKMFTLAGQIVCTDAGRLPVQREFNRRMKMRFQELGIALALPS